MTRTSGTYGWKGRQLDDVAVELARSLGVELEPRHSLYYGDYYRWDGDDGSELVLQDNFLEDDGELTAPDHPDHGVLLHASLFDRSMIDAIAGLPGVELLEER